MKKNKHEFALFFSELKHNKSGHVLLTNGPLVQRIVHVLRLKAEDAVLLFDQKEHAFFKIEKISKKGVTGQLHKKEKNKELKPSITLLLPVLKKEALEQAIYGAVECGVSEIQLVTTEKVQRKWGGQKELERLERIIIAAAEQCKQFAIPFINTPESLEIVLKNTTIPVFFADPAGKKIKKVTQDCAVLVGPEGDLTEDEKELLKKQGVQFFKLTPTILRAQMAAVVSVAMIRLVE